MQKVLALIKPVRAGFHTVIVMGLSMGGYASIKYSAALRANSVVAFSAFYSIDPEELQLTPELRALRDRLMPQSGIVPRDEYSTMAPRPQDVSGSIFAVYDENDVVDRHSGALLEKLPGVTTIALSHIGHLTNAPYFNQIVMFKLIDALISGGVAEVRRVFLAVSRRRPAYAVETLRAAARRKPALALRAINSMRLGDSASQAALRDSDLATQLISAFVQRGD